MSTQALSWVFDESETDGATRLVMIGIANHVDRRGDGWAYVDEVLRVARCSLNSYHRAVRAAVEMGELSVEVRQGGRLDMRGGHRPNLYVFPRMMAESCGTQPGEDTESCGTQPGYHRRTQPGEVGGTQPGEDTSTPLRNDPSMTRQLPLGAEQARPPKKPRPPDPVWDAMVGVCGLTGATPTPRERDAWNGAAKGLRVVQATPDEISRRGAEHRRRWPQASLTPTSLARHWAELSTTSEGSGGMTEAEYLAEKARPAWL